MTAKVLLAPILLIQGPKVRRNTPTLTEPLIDRQGSVGSGAELRLMLLGDSSAAGVGAETAQDTLLGQLIKLLSQDYQLSYQLVAKTGKTSAEAVAEIKAMPDQKLDVVITALGVNDVTSQVPVKTWYNQQTELIELLQQKFSPRIIIMSGLPPVRDFPALPWPLNFYMGLYADELNRALQKLTASESQVTFHSLRDYPVEAKAATDGFHPGPKVYELWAKYLVDLISK
jgi:lysophospholipase L1-like esterase